MSPVEDNAPRPTTVSPEELEALHDILNFGGSDVAAHIRADGELDFRALIVAFFARATTTLRALALLIENGFGQQAVMLNRVIFELVVDAYWINENQDLAAERFVKHARLDQHLQRETLTRYPAWLDRQISDERLDDAELTQLGKLYKGGASSWTGRTFKQRVEDIAKSFDDDLDRRQLRSFYDIVHQLNNRELHPTPWSLRRVLRLVPTTDGCEMLQFRLAPEPGLGQFALRCAWWMYLQMLHLLINLFEMPLTNALELLAEEAPWTPAP